MNELILPLYDLFAKNNIKDINIVNYILFMIFSFTDILLPGIKPKINITQYMSNTTNTEWFKTHIDDIKQQYNKKYKIFNFITPDVIYNLADNIIDIFKTINMSSLDIVDNIFVMFLRNENLNIVKEYFKYYNNKLLSKFIVDIAKVKIDNTETIFDGNMKINSCIDVIVDKYCAKSLPVNMSKIYGQQSNTVIKEVILTNLSAKLKNNFDDNIITTDIIINDFNVPVKLFDLILFDLPSDIRNIIHANSCQKIKKLKIRGTKCEPLLLQLIMCTLNKNGRAVIVVPDSLLFSDSIQPIETRKYLLENFNVKKIMQIHESIYLNKNTKNSILYFENNGKTTMVEFSKIHIVDDKLVEKHVSNIEINIIKSNMCSLYYNNYESINTHCTNKTINFNCVDSLFDISSNLKDSMVDDMLVLTKYYKDNRSVLLTNSTNVVGANYDIFITYKNTPNEYLLKYLKHLIQTKYEQFVKGKMKQFDINKIRQIQIPILSEISQKTLCNYLKVSHDIIDKNNDLIKMYEQLKFCILGSIPQHDMIEINDICAFNTSKTKCIGIIKNGLTAGSIYLLDNVTDFSKNSHYLAVTNYKFLIEYVFYWLQFKNDKIKELANLTSQTNLNQSNLMSIKVPIIGLEQQKDIISNCSGFEDIITKLNLTNKNITDKDIMSMVFKLNNLEL
jgi:hypothetical protein